MRVTAFLGSPRKNGNTACLLDWVLKEIGGFGHKTEIIHLADKKISGCIECFACQKVAGKTGCGVKDDMQPIYDSFLSADCILIASPVFCWSFSGQMKPFLDRTYCFEKFSPDGSYVSIVEGKKCGLLLTGAGDWFDGADLMVENFRRFADFHRMENVGHLVAANIKEKADILTPDFKKSSRKFFKSFSLLR